METRYTPAIAAILLFLIPLRGFPANTDDYRTKNTGNWNQASTWQRYDGSNWVDATTYPTYLNNEIDVRSGHTVAVTADVTIDDAIVHGTININSGVTVTISNGTGTDLYIITTVNVNGTLLNNGTISSETVELVFNNGSVYKHNYTGGTVPDAVWNDGSTCEITGVTSDGSISNLDQSFYHFKWNSTSQTSECNCSGNLQTVRGNFIMTSTGSGSFKLCNGQDYTLTVTGNWDHQGGTLILGDGTSYGYVNLNGNFSMSGGKITEYANSGYITKISFNKTGVQTYSKTSGTFENNIDFEIVSGSTLDMGENIVDGSLGQFSVSSGGTIRTAHSGGIAASGASGCIRTGSRYYSTGASYHYNRAGAQSTGTGLPSPLSGKLIAGSTSNATSLTLTNGSVTINGSLVLVSNAGGNSSIVSGTVSYGSGGSLEYQGASGQTASSSEWPASASPPNVNINNSNGVTLPVSFDRTLTGTLSLTSGFFNIGPNTLTLNNAGISRTSGSLTGGSNSKITFSGTGSTSLPAVQDGLNTLTMNRSGSTLTISGNVNITGSLILTNGAISLGAGIITYGGSGTLKYNGSASQTTTNAEFPASSGPYNLTIDNGAGVILHAGRTLNGTLTLTNGAFSIGSGNTLVLNKDISPGSGSLTGGSTSGITFGENPSPTSLPAVSGGLNNLTINRAAGISLGTGLTVAGALTLTNGALTIGANTLTLSGSLSRTSGTLNGGLTSDIVVSGSSMTALDLPGVVLNNLTLNRPGGLRLIGNVTVNGTMTMTTGALNLNGWSLGYGATATLRYNGNSTQTTSDSEFPGSSGPFNLTSENAVTLNLHSDRTISGNLVLNAGSFSIGAHTITLNGGIIQNPGGSLSGGTSSNVIFGGTGGSTALPAVTLNNLTINRAAGIGLGGSVTVEGTLNLLSGNLSIDSYNLTINGDISYTSNLAGTASSTLAFGGTGSAAAIHDLTLGTLTLNRSSGLDLTNPVTVSGQLVLQRGQVRRNGHTLYGPAAIVRYSYGASQSTTAEELPPSNGPRGITIDMMNPSDKMSLHDNYLIPGDLTLNRGLFSIGPRTLTLEGMINTGMGSLEGGTASNLVIGGTAGVLNLPAVKLNDLTVNRNAGANLEGEVSVSGILTLTSGKVMLANKNLVLGPPATIAGTPSASAMVVATAAGELRKEFPAGFTGSFEYPLGDSFGPPEYSPVTLDFTSGTFSTGNYAGVSLRNEKHPDPHVTGNYINRYWMISHSGISDFKCNAFFRYLPADVVGSEAILSCTRVDPQPWMVYSLTNPASHLLTAMGISSFSTFTGVKTTAPPEEMQLVNITIPDGVTTCYDAVQALTVAGNGTTFNVGDGGSATLIAGGRVSLLPGTAVEAGGFLSAYISTNGIYCPHTLNPIVASTPKEYLPAVSGTPGKQRYIRIYPNPATDVMTVEVFSDCTSGFTVTVYDMTGNRLQEKQFYGGNKALVSLAGCQAGIYLVHVRSGNRSEIGKVVKTD